MNVDQFTHAISLGLGRAVLQVREPLPSPYSDVVLEACLETKARDPQVEGSRAQYMLDIVRRTGEASVYIRQVLDALSDDPGTWDALQRFQIARLLAQEGDEVARQAMVGGFKLQIGSSMQDMFAEEFIGLDGISGLLFAIGEIGSELKNEPDRWVDDYLISFAEWAYGTEIVSEAISERAKIDQNVAQYVEAVNENRRLRGEHERQDSSGLPYEQIDLRLSSGDMGGNLAKWGELASSEDLELAAAALICETDATRIRPLLMIFRKRAFPLDCEHLLRLAALPDGPASRHALNALENLKDDRVRQLALALVESRSSLRGYAISLLANNFHPGDHQVVQFWCLTEIDPDIVNHFDRSLTRFFVAHPNPTVEAHILIHLYDLEPCSHCRCSIVERLIQLGKLPDTLRGEAAFDSYPETRSLVET